MPLPKETSPKLPLSIETSFVLSLTSSHNAIARYCMQLFRWQYPWVARYPHGVTGEGWGYVSLLCRGGTIFGTEGERGVRCRR